MDARPRARQNRDELLPSDPTRDGALTAEEVEALIALWQFDGELENALSLFAPDAELRPLPGDGRVFVGVDAIAEWLREISQWMVYRPNQLRATKLADGAYVFAGRLQWMEGQQLRDEQVAWLVETRDGLVTRSIALRNATEAEETFRSRERG